VSSDHAPNDDNPPTDDQPGTVYADIDMPGYGGDIPELSDADIAKAAAVESELAQARARLGEVPAEVVIVNHAMGLYELGAIHLSSQPPRLAQAALAIDAFACLVEGLEGRLGPEAATLRDALSQIRLAFVQIKGAAASSSTS
jgi:hypothetical protein